MINNREYLMHVDDYRYILFMYIGRNHTIFRESETIDYDALRLSVKLFE